MPKRVDVPDYGIVEFPDSVSEAQIGEIIRTQILRQGAEAPRPEAMREVQPGARLGVDVEAAEPPPRATWQGASLPQSRAELGERLGQVGENVRTVAPHVISGGLSLGGALAGGALTGGPWGALAGETGGSLVGREVNKMLGFEEPGYAGDLAAALLPAVGMGVGKVAGKVLPYVAKRLPGVGFGLQEMGVQEARAIPGKLALPDKAADLYQVVAQGPNPPVQLDAVGEVAEGLLRQQMALAPELRSPAIVNQARGWLDLATDPRGVDFHTAWLGQKQLRQHIAGVGGLDEGARKLLDQAIMTDFEAIPGGVAGPLKQANRAYRREMALEELTGYIEGQITPAVQGVGSGRVNAGNVLKRFDKAMREDQLFAGAFSADEVADIRTTVQAISTYMPQGTIPGQSFGAGGGLMRYGFGRTLGLEETTAFGLSAVMEALPYALSTTPGRSLVRALAEHGQLWSHTGVKALTAFGRGAGRTAGQALGEGE